MLIIKGNSMTMLKNTFQLKYSIIKTYTKDESAHYKAWHMSFNIPCSDQLINHMVTW